MVIADVCMKKANYWYYPDPVDCLCFEYHQVIYHTLVKSSPQRQDAYHR